MIEKLKIDLADNYHSEDDEVIQNLVEYYTSIASNASNRKTNDELIKPYVYIAVKSAYLRRGDEGVSSSNEGISTTYIDIEEKLKKDIRDIRKKNI